MKKGLTAIFLLFFLIGFTSSAEVTSLSDCNSQSGMDPQFILASDSNSHILNFSSTDYSSGNQVICMDDNFSVRTASNKPAPGYTSAFSVTQYFTNPDYGSHVKVPAENPGLTTYLKYEGYKAIDNVGQGICSSSSNDCKFLFSKNNSGSSHGSHVGKKDSGENVFVELRTGFQVNVRSIEQVPNNRYKVNLNVSADTGTQSIGIFERAIDWNTSDNIESEAQADQGEYQFKTFVNENRPKNVTETLTSPSSYPSTGSYDVNISLRYILTDGRMKWQNRTLSLPNGQISWDRTMEVPPSNWVVIAPTDTVPPSRYSNCGSFVGYTGSDSGVQTLLQTPSTGENLPAQPMMGTFANSCEFSYNHATSPNTIKFGEYDAENKGGWNVTRLQSPMNYTKFYEGNTNCGSLLVYGVKNNELNFELVSSSTDSIVYQKKLPEKALVATARDCTVTR